jgi:hypothetical protein
MMAKIAFLRDTPVIIEGDHIPGAFRDTSLTSRAPVVIHNDNPVIPFCDGRLRTGIGTGRIVAVPAELNAVLKLRLAIGQFGPILMNGDQFDPVRRPIFLLAGHFASPAAPAESVVDIDFEVRHLSYLQLNHVFNRTIKFQITSYKSQINLKLQ